MAYVKIPVDLNQYEPKILFNLTKRQLICFSLGALLGIPVFLALVNIDTNLAVILMMIIMSPFFFMAMYKKNGQPFELILKQYIKVNFKKPPIRVYRITNFYEELEISHLKKEVNAIEKTKTKQKKRKNVRSR